MSDFDEEFEVNELITLLQNATTCNKADLQALEEQCIKIQEYVNELSDQGEDSEILIDLEDDISRILNDAYFRQDSPGPNATKCEELLRLVYKYIAEENVNVQVVLACNPHIPQDILELLMQSEEYWEEDGTQQALARNRKESWVLEKLAKSDQDTARYEVALNPSTPTAVLAELVTDTQRCNWQVQEIKFGEVSQLRGLIRWAVIQNPKTSKESLKQVLDGGLPSIDKESDEILVKLARDLLRP
jgi:hypothetical protein